MEHEKVRRFPRLPVTVVAVAVLVAGAGIAGVHQANDHAGAVERRLARAVAPLSEGDAVDLVVGGPSSAAFLKLQREVGAALFIERQGTELSAEVNSWWPFAARCVVADQTSTGWRTHINHSGNCPP